MNQYSRKPFDACFPGKPHIDRLGQALSQAAVSTETNSGQLPSQQELRSLSISQRSNNSAQYNSDPQKCIWFHDPAQICEIDALRRHKELVEFLKTIESRTEDMQRQIDSQELMIANVMQSIESEYSKQTRLLEEIQRKIRTTMTVEHSSSPSPSTTPSDEGINVDEFLQSRYQRKRRNILITKSNELTVSASPIQLPNNFDNDLFG